MEVVKSYLDKMMDLEKQYTLIILTFIIWLVKMYSGKTFENTRNKIFDAISLLFPKTYKILLNLFDSQFLYDITKLLIIFSGISLILFWIILIVQMVCKKYFPGVISVNGTQHTFNLFLGKFGVIPTNLYIFILLAVRIFSDNKIKVYVPNGIIDTLGFLQAGIISILILLGFFVDGKSKQNDFNND